MEYPGSCFSGLVGIRGTCSAFNTAYWLDDMPGIDLNKLAEVAEANTGTGEKLAVKLIEAAARFVSADIEAIYDAQYKVKNQLVSGCSLCKFLGTYSAGIGRGIMIKSNIQSKYSAILLDKLTVKMNSTGTYNIIITDDEKTKTIEYDFTAGYEYEFKGLKFSTKKKAIRVYFQENDPLLASLSCPRGSGCGCSGSTAVASDLIYTGLSNGVESQTGYGFLPCATITCDAEDLLCSIAHGAPRMVGMAVLYKTAELYFEQRLHTARNNRVAGVGLNDAKDDAKKYQQLYTDKLQGKGTRGIKDIVFTTLQQTNDVCVVCNSINSVAWATG